VSGSVKLCRLVDCIHCVWLVCFSCQNTWSLSRCALCHQNYVAANFPAGWLLCNDCTVHAQRCAVQSTARPGHSKYTGLVSQLRTSKMAENTGLDEEFKRIVTEMKPHARNLPQKSG